MSEAPQTTQGTGLAPNVAGALTYALGLVTGIVFLVIEKEDRFVRFHAAQSVGVSLVVIVLSIALSIVSVVLGFIPIVGWLAGLMLSFAVGVGSFALWVYLMYRAYQGDEWEVPLVGAQARRYASPTAIAPPR